MGRCPLWVKSRHVQRKKVMSALPPKADMCGAQADVRFVPKADIVSGISADKKPPGVSAFRPRVSGHIHKQN